MIVISKPSCKSYLQSEHKEDVKSCTEQSREKPTLRRRPSILLCDPIPKKLWGINPRTILGEEWWNEQTRIAKARMHLCCAACGVYAPEAEYYPYLECHEVYKVNWQSGIVRLKAIEPLCFACHMYIHNKSLETKVTNGWVSKKEALAILNRGDELLKKTRHRKRYPLKGTRHPDWLIFKLELGRNFYFMKDGVIREERIQK